MDLQALTDHLKHHPHSPLFARVAEHYSAQGKLQDAQTICMSGIPIYPSYSTAHLIVAKCYASVGQFEPATELLSQVIERYPDVPFLQALQKEWLRHIASAQTVYHDQPLVSQQPVDSAMLDEQPLENTVIQESDSSTVNSAVDFQIETFEREAQTLSSLKNQEEDTALPEPQTEAEAFSSPMPLRSDTSIGEGEAPQSYDEGKIVSKTLAEIYAQQGQYTEAIETYELLKRQRPQYAQEAEERIQDLKERIGSQRAPT